MRSLFIIGLIFSASLTTNAQECPELGNYVNCPKVGWVFGYSYFNVMMFQTNGVQSYDIKYEYDSIPGKESNEILITDNVMRETHAGLNIWGRSYCKKGKLVIIGGWEGAESNTGSRTEIYHTEDGDLRMDWYGNKNYVNPTSSALCTRVSH